jgi:hypothetical protein
MSRSFGKRQKRGLLMMSLGMGREWGNERRKVNNLLDPHTHPTALCEGDEISIEPYSFLSSSDPAIGIE